MRVVLIGAGDCDVRLAVAFRWWSLRAYVFFVHPERYGQVVDEFLASPWGTYLVDGKVAFTSV